jgi:hypothetical protein
MKRSIWSQQQLDYMYHNQDKSDIDISIILHLPISAIKYKRHTMNTICNYKSYGRWTVDEIEYLREHYYIDYSWDIATHLHRDVRCIWQQAAKIGLRKRKRTKK